MWGFSIFINGVQVFGCIFPDGGVYLHEPIVDAYACMADMLAEQPATNFQVIGPVLPMEAIKADVEANYQRNKETLQKGLEAVDADYKRALAQLGCYEQLAMSAKPEAA